MADWKEAPLYRALVDLLPAFVTPAQTPGQPDERNINVQKLRVALTPERSHEAIYKWFRGPQRTRADGTKFYDHSRAKLKPENARDLHALANQADNVAALQAAGREPPALTDFLALTLA